MKLLRSTTTRGRNNPIIRVVEQETGPPCYADTTWPLINRKLFESRNPLDEKYIQFQFFRMIFRTFARWITWLSGDKKCTIFE